VYGLNTETPRYEVHWPNGAENYPSARQLLTALHNGRDPRVTFNRYFRTDRLVDVDAGPTVFDLFATPESRAAFRREPKITQPRPKPVPQGTRHRCPASAGRWYRPSQAVAAAFTTLALFGSLDIAQAEPAHNVIIVPAFAWADYPVEPMLTVVTPTKVKPAGGISIAPHLLGIDLAARGHEVRKLLYKGFGARLARRGYEVEDVLQEVYKGLIARNRGRCPFDPRKSSFGHYVHMVCGCIVSNYERKMARVRENEQVGVYAPNIVWNESEDYGGMTDAALAATTMSGGDHPVSGNLSVESRIGTDRAFKSLLSVIEAHALDEMGHRRPEADLAARCLPLIYEGHQRGEIAKLLKMDTSRVGKALSFLRHATISWQANGLA
jgi:hypothetical protein